MDEKRPYYAMEDIGSDPEYSMEGRTKYPSERYPNGPFFTMQHRKKNAICVDRAGNVVNVGNLSDAYGAADAMNEAYEAGWNAAMEKVGEGKKA